jgi:peptidoglycan/xylan/chitin deacetylase (PgdA/CDA1 family)
MNKIALLSIDVEEWFHLDYINSKIDYSMLDGLDCFLDLAKKNNVPSTLFTLSDLALTTKATLQRAIEEGHEIALHGTSHKRPLEMTLDEFEADCVKGVDEINKHLGFKPVGYRASCFSLDRARLDILRNKLGFSYDSSRINFDAHPLYGSINMEGFNQVSEFLHYRNGFFEFEMPTISFLGKELPISGGGYLRIFPWWLLSIYIKKYIRKNNLFSIYIHPFELSSVKPPAVKELDLKTRFRFKYNIKRVPLKLDRLIKLLKEEGFEFMTCKQARDFYVAGSRLKG